MSLISSLNSSIRLDVDVGADGIQLLFQRDQVLAVIEAALVKIAQRLDGFRDLGVFS